MRLFRCLAVMSMILAVADCMNAAVDSGKKSVHHRHGATAASRQVGMDIVHQIGTLGIERPIVHGGSEKARLSKMARSNSEAPLTAASGSLKLTVVALPIFALVVCTLVFAMLYTERGRQVAASLGLFQETGWKHMAVAKSGDGKPEGWAAIALESPIVQSAMAVINGFAPGDSRPTGQASEVKMKVAKMENTNGEAAREPDNALAQLEAFASSSSTKNMLQEAMQNGTGHTDAPLCPAQPAFAEPAPLGPSEQTDDILLDDLGLEPVQNASLDPSPSFLNSLDDEDDLLGVSCSQERQNEPPRFEEIQFD